MPGQVPVLGCGIRFSTFPGSGSPVLARFIGSHGGRCFLGGRAGGVLVVGKGKGEVLVAWEPQPGPQRAAIACPVQDLAYGGARGGGKTSMLIGDFAIHAGRYGKQARGIIFRRTYDELLEIERKCRDIYGLLGWAWKASEREWTAPDGATLLLRYLDRDEDADHWQGAEFSFMAFDQLEQWPSPEPIDRLWGSLRSAHGVPIRRRSTFNPPAPGWIKERYIDPKPWGKPFKYRPSWAPPGMKYEIEAVFIFSKLEDNPLLLENDPDYEARLAASGGEALYKAWRWGDWTAQVGQVFTEWRQDLHVLDRWVHLPNWRLAGGLDWGYRAPHCFLLFDSGPDGDVVACAELYGKERHAREVGLEVGQLCRVWGPVEYIAGDEQMWYRTGQSAPTVAEELQEGIWEAYQGRREMAPVLISASHGRGSRQTKKQVMHRMLSWSQDEKRVVQPWMRPKLRVVKSCENLIRTLPLLTYDRTKPEDVDSEAEDHAYDSACAYLMSRPPEAETLPEYEEPDLHPGLTRSGRRRSEEMWAREREPGEAPRWRMPRGRGEGSEVDWI